jgi:hypothetical protein
MATDQQGNRTSQQGDGQDDTSAEPSSAGSVREQSGDARGAGGESAAQARAQRGSEVAGGASDVDRRPRLEQLGDEEAGDGMGS